MARIDTDRDWEEYGRSDPFYGVITDERFRMDRIDEQALTEFFALGQSHVDAVVMLVRDHLVPAFRPQRALDFGCGVGRLLIPLSHICERVVGVDVSESMLAEAQRQCVQRGITNVDLVRSDDTLSRVHGPFDFIHSHIVFQHIPPERGEGIAAAMIDLLEMGGVGCLHFTYHWDAKPMSRLTVGAYRAFPPLYRLRNRVKGKPDEPMIQMNEYDLNRIFLMLQSKGCQRVYTQFTDHGVKGVMLMFQKRPAPSL